MSIDTASEQALIARWIEPNPHKAGPADSWVLPRYVPVWSVVRQLQLDSWKAALVAEDYELPVEAVEAAIRYYHHHKSEVDARIERNQALLGA